MTSKGEKGILTLYSDVQATSVRWLWYPFIAVGKITLLQGDPGDGKSTIKPKISYIQGDLTLPDETGEPYEIVKTVVSGSATELEFYTKSRTDYTSTCFDRNIPAIRHLLQHSRRSARRRVLLWNKESCTEEVKKNDRRIPKGERKALWLVKYECG